MGRLSRVASPGAVLMALVLSVSITGCDSDDGPPTTSEARPTSGVSGSASAGASSPPKDASTSGASPGNVVPDLLPAQIQPTFGPGDQLKALPWRDQPTSWDPVDSVPLGSDPLQRAVVAVEQGEPGGPTRIHLLGGDGRWRYVDLPASHFESSWLSRASLSPQGTRLAFRTQRRIKVCNISTGRIRSFRSARAGRAGANEIFWSRTDRPVVLLGSGQGGRGWSKNGLELNLKTGKSRQLPYDPSQAAFLPGGVVLTSPQNIDAPDSLPAWQWFDRDGALIKEVDSELGVGYVTHLMAKAGRVAFANQTMTDPRDGRRLYGVSVVDDHGRPLAMLPVRRWDLNGFGGGVFGWLDQKTVLVQVMLPDYTLAAVSWHISSGRLERVADFADHPISVAVDNL